MSETSAAPELIIGHFIRLLRVSHNINQIELAKRLKTSRTYLSQVENGQREPVPSILTLSIQGGRPRVPPTDGNIQAGDGPASAAKLSPAPPISPAISRAVLIPITDILMAWECGSG